MFSTKICPQYQHYANLKRSESSILDWRRQKTCQRGISRRLILEADRRLSGRDPSTIWIEEEQVEFSTKPRGGHPGMDRGRLLVIQMSRGREHIGSKQSSRERAVVNEITRPIVTRLSHRFPAIYQSIWRWVLSDHLKMENALPRSVNSSLVSKPHRTVLPTHAEYARGAGEIQ